MIKRLLLILAAAFGLVVVGAAAANASETGGHHEKAGHHKVDKQRHHGAKHHNVKHHKPVVKHHPSHPTKPGCICKPKPTPPPGGWPCTKTHSCKPHKPHCGPGHKPPHVKPPVHHKPPAHKPPAHRVVKHHSHPVLHRTHMVTTSSVVPSLPRTGGFAVQLLELGLIMLFIGGMLVAVPRRRSGDVK
jgi:hypothetical protein